MNGWSLTQNTNGMIVEQMACGCTQSPDAGGAFDEGCGDNHGDARVMSDVSSMFIVYLHELYKWGGDEQILKDFWSNARNAALWHLNAANSTSSGLLESMCNTYDIANPPAYQLVSYNEIFHLLALRAASKLARTEVIDDSAFADECDAAFDIAQEKIYESLWNENSGKGFFSFNNENRGDLMADSLYPQVLSFANGLGNLVDDEKILQHLDREVEFGDSPYGIVLLTTNYGEDWTDLGNQGNGVWQMATGDWSALNLRMGDRTFEDSMSQVEKSLKGWREGVNDLWNVAGISDQSSGLPTITSHYGYWMTMWHVVLQASGQDVDLVAGTLTFDVKVPIPFKLPVLMAGSIGTIESEEGSEFTFTLTGGKKLTGLKKLAVGGVEYSNGGDTFDFAVGDAVTWQKK